MGWRADAGMGRGVRGEGGVGGRGGRIYTALHTPQRPPHIARHLVIRRARLTTNKTANSTCLERCDWPSLGGDALLDVGALVLRNAALTVRGTGWWVGVRGGGGGQNVEEGGGRRREAGRDGHTEG